VVETVGRHGGELLASAEIAVYDIQTVDVDDREVMQSISAVAALVCQWDRVMTSP
jgi:hypothetical protein